MPTGAPNWSAAGTRPGSPSGATGRSIRRTAWWRGRWSSGGRRPAARAGVAGGLRSLPAGVAAAARPGGTRPHPGAGRRHPVLVARRRDPGGGPQGDRPRPGRAGDRVGRRGLPRASSSASDGSGGTFDRASVTPTDQSLRAVGRLSANQTVVEAAVAAGQTSREIAECLNREGFRPPSNPAGRFTPERARDLVYRLGLRPRRRPAEGAGGRRMVASATWRTSSAWDTADSRNGSGGAMSMPGRREPEASGDLGRCRRSGSGSAGSGTLSVPAKTDPLSRRADSPQGAAGSGFLALCTGRRYSIPEASTAPSWDSAVTQRRVLGSEGTVRAFRAGATTRALGTVHPLANLATARGAVQDVPARYHVRMAITGYVHV